MSLYIGTLTGSARLWSFVAVLLQLRRNGDHSILLWERRRGHVPAVPSLPNTQTSDCGLIFCTISTTYTSHDLVRPTWVCSSKKSASFFSGAGVWEFTELSIHSWWVKNHTPVTFATMQIYTHTNIHPMSAFPVPATHSKQRVLDNEYDNIRICQFWCTVLM